MIVLDILLLFLVSIPTILFLALMYKSGKKRAMRIQDKEDDDKIYIYNVVKGVTLVYNRNDIDAPPLRVPDKFARTINKIYSEEENKK